MPLSRYLLTAAALALSACTLALLPPAPASPVDIKESTDIAVVVNPQNPANDISLSTLKKLVLGEEHQWKNKARIALVLRQPGTREREIMLSRIAQMKESEFKQLWMARVFRGESDVEPFTVPSNGSASAYVEVSPGGIAFMPGTDVRRDLKVLKVDGHLPGEGGYPLK